VLVVLGEGQGALRRLLVHAEQLHAVAGGEGLGQEQRGDDGFGDAALAEQREWVRQLAAIRRRRPDQRVSVCAPGFSHHIHGNRHEMQRAAGQDEQVPDAVPVPEAFVEGEEDDPDGVEDPARHQPAEARAAEGGEQRLDRHQGQPAPVRRYFPFIQGSMDRYPLFPSDQAPRIVTRETEKASPHFKDEYRRRPC